MFLQRDKKEIETSMRGKDQHGWAHARCGLGIVLETRACVLIRIQSTTPGAQVDTQPMSDPGLANSSILKLGCTSIRMKTEVGIEQMWVIFKHKGDFVIPSLQLALLQGTDMSGPSREGCVPGVTSQCAHENHTQEKATLLASPNTFFNSVINRT